MYQSFKTEYLDLCQKFGRDTTRKIKNDLKKDAFELQYRIDAIKTDVEQNGMAWLYGYIHTGLELRTYQRELKFTKQLLTEL